MPREIVLTKGMVAIVDEEDYERAVAFKWSANNCNGRWYARRLVKSGKKRRVVYLHRFLVNAPAGLMVDHKNGNGLDCCRKNMRLATNGQNQSNARMPRNNTTGFLGVGRVLRRWKAQISINGNKTYLGTYTTAEAAASAYDAKVREIRGEFGRTNF